MSKNGKTAGLQELWVSQSHKVLACVFCDPGAVFVVREIIRHNAHWFAPKEAAVWRAVLACLEADTPPTIEAVGSRMDGVSVDYLNRFIREYNDLDNSFLIYNTEELKKLGILMKLHSLGQELTGLSTVTGIGAMVSHAETELVGLAADKSDRQADAKAVDITAWAMADKFTGDGIPTGLGWFDTLTGGLWPGMNYWIAAPYKSGKTTLMRNILLTAAEHGIAVSAYCAEGRREMFTLDCQAALATKYMLAQGVKRDECRLSGLFLLRSWTKHAGTPIFSRVEYEAIHRARQVWQELPIWVYDTPDGIRDLTSLHYSIKRDKMRYGVQVAFMDYSQLFGTGGTVYERQSATALKAQEIAQNENVAIGILAQLNEAQIKDNNSYSPGVKGGGDAPAAADFLLIPRIDPEARHLLELQLKLSRHTATGQGTHLIVPNSGLIIGDVD